MTGPGGVDRRRYVGDDHHHLDMWSKEEHRLFEDKLDKRFAAFQAHIDRLNTRITLMLGALGLIAFLLPIVAPFLRAIIGIDVPSDR